MAKTKKNAPVYAPEHELRAFSDGHSTHAWECFGAHAGEQDGVPGYYFRVWAPHAQQVCVFGYFNDWDPNANPLTPVQGGIWEGFIPGLQQYDAYKYAVHTKDGRLTGKADPFAFHAETRPGTASKLYDLSGYQWGDRAWLDYRAKNAPYRRPMNIYECHLGSWRRTGEGEFLSYRDLAAYLVPYVKELGFTHVELLPVTEHPLDASWGYQCTGYFAATSRFGIPDDLKYLVDQLHQAGIGVIMDWVPAHFPRDEFGLYHFDGTPTYEYADPRKGEHADWGTNVFDYGRNEVRSFLFSNAMFWLEEYHMDGLRVDAVASMLYLDYGKQDGEWVPNIYGGNENLEAVEFLKHLNSIFKKKHPGAVLIAEESTAWPQVTGDVKEGSLGFDYKWNMGWMNDFLGYMQYDPYFRCHHYGELTFSMLYAYSEDFVLVFSHDEVVHGKGSMAGKMPGETLEAKYSNLRAAYSYMMTHPGKKLLFMGQDFGQMSEWNENESLPWDLLKYDKHSQTKAYVKALNELYYNTPALHEKDFHPDGFQWINCTSSKDNIVVFLRKTDRPEETLLVTCNFAPVTHEKFQVGVPFAGKYKEILNSEDKKFGGSGIGNSRIKASKKKEADGREDSIEITLAPLGVQIFSCTPVKEKKADAKKADAKKVETKKSAAKKVDAKKPAKPAVKKPAKPVTKRASGAAKTK